MKLINPEVRIETTSFCNYNCKICPRDKMTRPKVTMDFDHFMDLAMQAEELGATLISLFGYGEPLMDKTLPEKIEICSELGLDTFITSNASLLDVEMYKKLRDAGLSEVRISHHALKPDNYEDVHGCGFDYDNIVLRNIYNFIACNRTDGGNIKIGITVIPMHGESVDDIRTAWEHNGVDYLEIWKPHNWAYGRQYRDVKIKKRTCGRPHRGPIQINADGKMMVCCFDFDAHMTVGDTYQDSIENILKGDTFKKIRIAHETGMVDGLPCEHCDQLNIEDENPLLYSSRDQTKTIGCTSSTKFKLEDIKDGTNTE